MSVRWREKRDKERGRGRRRERERESERERKRERQKKRCGHQRWRDSAEGDCRLVVALPIVVLPMNGNNVGYGGSEKGGYESVEKDNRNRLGEERGGCGCGCGEKWKEESKNENGERKEKKWEENWGKWSCHGDEREKGKKKQKKKKRKVGCE